MSIGPSEIVWTLSFKLGLGMRLASYPGGEKHFSSMQPGYEAREYTFWLQSLPNAKLDYVALIDKDLM